MKLVKIAVRNLRCIDEITISAGDFTSLIGPNNSGKSSMLRAIELLLNQETPDPEEWRDGNEDKEIQIEGEFYEIGDWEKNAPGVSSIVYDNRIRIRLLAKLNRKTRRVEKYYEAFAPVEIVEGWSEKWGELSVAIKKKAEEMNVLNGSDFKSADIKRRLRQKIRETMPEKVTLSAPRWTRENVGIEPALRHVIPQAQIVSALRDAQNDGKPGENTALGLLLHRVILPAVQNSAEYDRLLSAVDALQKSLCSEGKGQISEIKRLMESLSGRLCDVIEGRVFLAMEAPDAHKFIGATTALRLDDGTKTPIALQGHGLQRSLVFALLEELAIQKARVPLSENIQRSRSTVLLFEEPELFMHPHIMRRLKTTLQTIAKKVDWQVIITTHSPFLINIGEDPCSLVVFQRQHSKTAPIVKQLQEDPFGSDDASRSDREALRAVLNFHPSICEAFFAKRTVLVEGDSEMALLVHQPRLYEKLQVDAAQRNLVTIVSCAGKWTIPPIANLLKKFQIPFRIIHDRDRKGKTDAELGVISPIHPYNANIRIAEFAKTEDILVIEDTLEDLFWNARPEFSGDKPYRIWNRVNELCDSQDPIDPRIENLIKFAFQWT